MTTRRWQEFERVELLCREKTSQTRGPTRSKCEQHALASGMTRSAVGSSLEIRYFFGRQARLFYEWIARQRMRDCAMLLHSIAITNRYKGFVTMYFRSLRTNLSLFVLSWILFENEFRCRLVFDTWRVKNIIIVIISKVLFYVYYFIQYH